MSYYRLSFRSIFGLGLAAIGEKAEPVKGFLNGTLEAVFLMINKILKLAQLSICIYLYDSNDFCASALIPLFKLLVVVVFAMVFFVIVVLGIVARMVGISIFQS